jgi:alanine dehydrogenase
MQIGILDEHRRRGGHERRTPLTPQRVLMLAQAGHKVRVERGAGLGAGFREDEWRQAGADVVHRAVEVLAASDFLLTLSWLGPDELEQVKPGTIALAIHRLEMAPPDVRRAFAKSGVLSISADRMLDERGVPPVFDRVGDLAGALLPQVAARLLESTAQGRRGVILTRLPGIAPAEVVILGAGRLGASAALHFARAGASVQVLDQHVERLRQVAQWLPESVVTLASGPNVIDRAVRFADVLVGAAGKIGERAPILVSPEQIAAMRAGSVALDMAIDHGGNIATSRPTPTVDDAFDLHGVVHLAMPNLTTLVARTASRVLSQSLAPFVHQIAGAADPKTHPAFKSSEWSGG